MKKISVIVPVYNVEKYLKRCINSIINQTYKNLDIILIDDGSTDNSGRICDEYLSLDNRIRVIHKKNEGQSIARKIGLENSIGKLISFIDADDVIDLNFYSILEKKFEEEKVDIAYCKVKKFNNEIIYDNKKNVTYEIKTVEDCLKDIVSKDSIFNNFMVNKLYRKDLFNNINFPINNIFEDLTIMYNIIDNSKTIYYADIYLYFYYNRLDSSTKKIKSSNIIYKLNIINEREKFITNYYSNLIDYYELYHIKNIIYCATVLAKNNEKLFFKNIVKDNYIKNKIQKFGIFKIYNSMNFKYKVLFMLYQINTNIFYYIISNFFSYN